jgi:hypothetical protein
MFTRTRIPVVLSLVFAFALFLGLTGLASAHGHTTVGDYELVIGFHGEPAYAGQPNGLDLFVTNLKTNQKVNGLEKTLKAEIIYGSARRTLPVEAQWGEDGAYTAYVEPTQPGDYTWHITGMIENTPVDVSMSSSPTTFSSVEARSTVAFPAAEATAAELQAQAAAAMRMAQIALLAAVVLSVIALAVALLSRRSVTKAARAAVEPARSASEA